MTDNYIYYSEEGPITGSIHVMQLGADNLNRSIIVTNEQTKEQFTIKPRHRTKAYPFERVQFMIKVNIADREKVQQFARTLNSEREQKTLDSMTASD